MKNKFNNDNLKNEKVMHKQSWGLPLLKIWVGFMLLTFLILILTLSIINAGCCFDNGIGTCSASSEESACVDFGGEYFGGSCSAVDLCQDGCCVLGSNTEYANSGRCAILSRNLGFTENFQAGMSRADCDLLSRSSEQGACVSGEIKPYDCEFTTRQQCPTDFYPGVSCTSAELNTTCKKTTNTMCYEEKLYSKDSCGNPDAVLDNCDFASGKICTTKSSNSAYCKDLNCANGAKNGESWCVDTWGNTPFGVIDATPDRKTDQHYTGENSGWVGSRYFTQYCLNGDVITEPCADFRADTCTTGDNGQATCEANPAAQCIAANSASDASSGSGSKDSSGAAEEDCNSNSCNFLPGFSGSSGLKNIPEKYSEYKGIGSECSSPQTVRDAKEMITKTDSCVPKVPGGLQFYPPQSSDTLSSESQSSDQASTAEQVCSLGNFKADVIINPIFLGGCIDTDKEGSVKGNCIYIDECTLDSSLGTGDLEVLAAPGLVDWLNERCHGLGDCDGAYNWVKASSGPSEGEGKEAIKPELVETLTVDGKEYPKYEIAYSCKPFKAPSGDSDCALCGKEGLQCSEYRCKSLGSGCEFKSVNGIGNCISSSDKSAPIITLKEISPASPIPPYSPVQISISTDKLAECKFNLGNGGSKYEDMKYGFGDGYTVEHSTKLYLPGQDIFERQNATGSEYQILSGKGGNYSMFVRCIGINGKYNLDAKLIQFQVMNTPDTTILDPKNFNPASGSKIAYNTTQKLVKFYMNEPIECKWDVQDKSYDSMKNYFDCDFSVSTYNMINGYSCSGILMNVTLNLDSQSKYYIRCKDQPYLMNDTLTIRGINYTRNEMDHGYEYILKPSEKLEIAEVSPSGQIFVSGKNTSVELEAITSGGSTDGTAKCYWKHSNETLNFGVGYYNFAKTNYFDHKQTIAYPTIGNNFIQVKCEDSAGNIEYKNSTFNVQIDTSPPSLIRLYETDNKNKLIVKTIEDAVCYFSFDKSLGCSFSYLNSTQMDGVEKEHTAQWKYDTTYYIKCKDYRGNENTGNCANMF